MDAFKKYIGTNWFLLNEEISTLATNKGLRTGLKIKGDKIHLAHNMLVDVPDINVDDDRLTVVIDAEGKILQFYRG